MTKTVVKTDLESETFCNSKSYTPLKEKKLGFYDYKFYQKLFVVIISLSSILIFPESPKELEKICQDYNSSNFCSVW